jgi:hypothetical protein
MRKLHVANHAGRAGCSLQADEKLPVYNSLVCKKIIGIYGAGMSQAIWKRSALQPARNSTLQ